MTYKRNDLTEQQTQDAIDACTWLISKALSARATSHLRYDVAAWDHLLEVMRKEMAMLESDQYRHKKEAETARMEAEEVPS